MATAARAIVVAHSIIKWLLLATFSLIVVLYVLLQSTPTTLAGLLLYDGGKYSTQVRHAGAIWTPELGLVTLVYDTEPYFGCLFISSIDPYCTNGDDNITTFL